LLALPRLFFVFYTKEFTGGTAGKRYGIDKITKHVQADIAFFRGFAS
jgi:hypothetical protein